MIAAISMVYGALVWLLFAKFRLVKPSPVSIVSAIAIGLVLIGAIVIGWQFSAPNSSNLVVQRYTVQIVPQVKGPIEKIHAEPNVPLKGDVDILFEIQKDPYQYAVDQLTADVEAAKQTVLKSEAAVEAAVANLARTEADELAARTSMEMAQELKARESSLAISKMDYVRAVQEHKAAVASVEQARATEKESEFALKVATQGVPSLEARLRDAKFNLEQCTVRAPSDGFVVNWQVREGTMAVSLPLAPVGTFIDTSSTTLVATFGQNTLKYVERGQLVEVALKSHPGQVFNAKVINVIRASGEGQFVTTGVLGSVADIGSDGMAAVTLEIDDREVSQQLGMGTAGGVAIYTNHGKPFHIISKVVVRMQALGYYLIPK